MFDSLMQDHHRLSTRDHAQAYNLPKWKKVGLFILNEPIYFGLLNAVNVLAFIGALSIDSLEHTSTMR